MSPPPLFLEDMQKCLYLRIVGRVQGVFFRHSARGKAEALGLAGWVRNSGNRAVEIVAEGDEAALKEFLGWAQAGPPLAKVEQVSVDWSEATGEFGGFEIR